MVGLGGGGGNWAERDLTRGWRVRGDCGGSFLSPIVFVGPGMMITSVEAAAEFAARAEAERSDDARGGGSGGACPSDIKDVDDDVLSVAGTSDIEEVVDVDGITFASVIDASEADDVDETGLSACPDNETNDVDETIFLSIGTDCPLRTLREDRRGGIGGGGPAAGVSVEGC